MTDAVLVHIEDAVAWITLNRPDALNAINDDVRRLLPEAVAKADANPQVRVIVVRGAGPRAFCVGADIKEFGTAPQPAAYRQARVHHHWITAFDRALKPVIAAVHGHCLGGGLEIALACDIRIAATNATFGLPETGHGIIPGAGGTQRITRVLGMGVALDLVLTGERLDAERALAMGLVSRLAAPEALQQAAGDLARHIAARPPLAMQFAKEAVRGGAELPLADGMRLESDLSAHLVDTQDRQEAARAFQEKRPPRYTGQ
ncbi:enoyl-CoA hydratase/isomerase family protein [Bordetella petrii]|nr:enoyl-CoA hydratase/isomerase family protein [Bordetella petrii]